MEVTGREAHLSRVEDGKGQAGVVEGKAACCQLQDRLVQLHLQELVVDLELTLLGGVDPQHPLKAAGDDLSGTIGVVVDVCDAETAHVEFLSAEGRGLPPLPALEEGHLALCSASGHKSLSRAVPCCWGS